MGISRSPVAIFGNEKSKCVIHAGWIIA